MTTIFSTRKTLKDRFSKRILGMEALENREMLSVNPLGVDNYYSPEVVQTNAAQNFQTEVGETVAALTFSEVTHTGMKVTIPKSGTSDLGNAQAYYFQYKNISNPTANSWVQSATTVTSKSDGTLNDDVPITLSSLTPGITYEFRLNKTSQEVTDSSSTTITLTDTQATVPAPTIASTSFDSSTHTLTVNLSGLINGASYTLAGDHSNSGTPAFDGTGVSSTNLTAPGTTAVITITTNTYTLEENDTITFSLTGGGTALIDSEVLTAKSLASGEVAVTGGTTVTGLTSNAATITVPKVKNAKTYDITVGSLPTITGSTKNQVTVTGLDPDTQYDITVLVKDKNNTELNLDGTENTNSTGTPFNLGSFSTWDEEAAASVKYPAINGSIAATYAATGKDYDGKAITTPGIKVTWKAPANYTGAYIVNIQKVTDKGVAEGGVGVKEIPAGFKAEAFIVAAGGFNVVKDAYYKITVAAGGDIAGSGSPAAIVAPEVVVATGTNKIENYNDANAAAGAATDPTGVAATAVTPTASAGFAIKATITPDTTPTNTVGYWVALYESGNAPSGNVAFNENDANIVALAYVANSGTTLFDVEFGGLTDTVKTYKAVAWAVNADGKDAGAVVDSGDASPAGPTNYAAAYIGAASSTYAGNLKTATVSGTPTSTKLTWANTQSNTATDVIVGWQVSYSIDDGDNWILAQQVAASTTEATVTGLNLADVKYQFKVQAIVKEDTSTNNFGLDKGATVTSSKANVTLAKVAKVTPATPQGVNKIEASWAAVTGASAYFVTVQDGKGIVYQGIVTTNSFDSLADAGLTLVPGVKYDISVSTIAYNGDKVVKAAIAKAAATTVKFSDPVLKIAQGQKAALTSVALAIDDKVAEPTSSARKYVIEYTYIADAKNKADWSTALVQESATSLTLSNLKAGTQYYARLVAYDSASTATSSNAERIVVGKELKFKTVAAPLATLTKPAFALDGNELALKFTGKVPVDKTGGNAVLQGSTKFFYELIVSTDAVLDKTTGKLANGKSFTPTPEPLDSKGGNGKDKDEFNTAISQALTGTNGVFEILNAGTLDPATFKALNFQLLVYYSISDANNAYASAYTKVTKLTLPKWFV